MVSKTTKVAVLVSAVLITGNVLASGQGHSPRLNDAMEYQIGGGFISNAPTTVFSQPDLEVGVSWDLNLECGKFDPKISVSNQLNGITEGFRDMMDNIISSATGAVSSLPALAIQRANPGLYDLLQQGILQGKMDFETAKTSCEDMSKVLTGEESFPFEQFKLGQLNKSWVEEMQSTGGDAVQAKKNVDDQGAGDAGTEWTCGNVKGGVGQEPIETISDVVIVGYNALFDRGDACTEAALSGADGADSPLWYYWKTPLEASAWANKVIGEMELRTCDGCKKMVGTPGKGLTYMHRDMKQSIYANLESLIDGSLELNRDNLDLVSAPPGLNITDVLIYAIRKRNPDSQKGLIDKLSGEIAYARLVEQGRLLTQLMHTGIKEPNVSNYAQGVEIVNAGIDQLQVEMDQLDYEIKTRESIAKNTIIRLLGLEEKNLQELHYTPHRRPISSDGRGLPE